MRLYRGLTRAFRSDKTPRQPGGPMGGGTDFTDCPFTALEYARGRSGVVLVIDVPAGVEHRVREELWMAATAKRYMVWGAFDAWIIAELPAKDLRPEVRKKGMIALSSEDKSRILKSVIEDLVARPRAPQTPPA